MTSHLVVKCPGLLLPAQHLQAVPQLHPDNGRLLLDVLLALVLLAQERRACVDRPAQLGLGLGEALAREQRACAVVDELVAGLDVVGVVEVGVVEAGGDGGEVGDAFDVEVVGGVLDDVAVDGEAVLVPLEPGNK